jgi:hypothetical protein
MMKKIQYRKVKRALKYTYFRPDDESKKRLLKKLGVSHSEELKEHRFVTEFKIALAAAVALICLLNINSVKQKYLDRYDGENIVTISKLVSNSSLLEEFISVMEN